MAFAFDSIKKLRDDFKVLNYIMIYVSIFNVYVIKNYLTIYTLM